MSSLLPKAYKRLLIELKSVNSSHDHINIIPHLAPLDDASLHLWSAVLKGMPGTVYQGGSWLLNIQIPPNYPNSPPKITFETPICHPNVNFSTGEICLDLLKSAWSPAYTLLTSLVAVHQLLSSAEPDSPLNVDIARLFRLGDSIAAESLIRYYTTIYRHPSH